MLVVSSLVGLSSWHRSKYVTLGSEGEIELPGAAVAVSMTIASQGAFAAPLKKLVFSGALTLICRSFPVGSSMVLCSRILIELAVKSGSAEAWLSEPVDAEVVELVWVGAGLA